MNIIKEAQNIAGFTTYVPLLIKATSDDDSPTPGYLYDEIIKMSQLSTTHLTQLIDFLVARLQASSWPGKRKVIRVFLKLTQKGDYNTRAYLRLKDSHYRHAASQGGPPDPLLGNTPQLFLNSDIQELLGVLFDPRLMNQDEEDARRGYSSQESTNTLAGGYGSSGNQGKYEGFGNTAPPKERMVTQKVKDMVESFISGSENSDASQLSENDPGSYRPVSLSSLGMSFSQPTMTLPMSVSTSGPPSISSSMASSRTREHVPGRPGGCWANEEDLDSFGKELQDSCSISSCQSIVTPRRNLEEQFLQDLHESMPTWPVNVKTLVEKCRQCSNLDKSLLLGKINGHLSMLLDTKENPESESPSSLFHESVVLLLLIEYGLHYDVFSPILTRSILSGTLEDISKQSSIESRLKMKSKKIFLILQKLS